ncbi:HEPN domain-containing protein [Allobaculum stercoricanis]|uniref:HEPN domain-containing protein n=2 Tax=Allobaculum stercoricanis TaxID=174709 RepID=UPI00248F0C12|nr:HEPN domain-containing protein [Allobaculum stercoricanis]
MKSRKISLTPRKEDTREARPMLVRFDLSEILQHFTESIDEIKKQFDVADELLRAGNEIACKMVWRSQVVLAEGLLDFYIHEMSKYCLVKMFSGTWPKTDKYKSFQIPMEKVEMAIATLESNDWFFEYLNERFSRDVFLSSESVKDQLNLIGIPFKQVMTKAFPSKNENEAMKVGKEVISNLFKRRNEIVHQNDRSHASAEQTDITKEYVEDYISKIESIVNAIQMTAKEKVYQEVS